LKGLKRFKPGDDVLTLKAQARGNGGIATNKEKDLPLNIANLNMKPQLVIQDGAQLGGPGTKILCVAQKPLEA
tara:strand:+ start:17146 stop:17364 length:219 start_codon:yes stop_codon:yes gene_type:complete